MHSGFLGLPRGMLCCVGGVNTAQLHPGCRMRAFCILGKFAVLEGDAPGEVVWASAICKCVQSDAGEGLQVAHVCNLMPGRVCRMS